MVVEVVEGDRVIHSMQGEDEDMEDGGTDNHGCLDNVNTHNSAGGHDGTQHTQTACHFFYTNMYTCVRTTHLKSYTENSSKSKMETITVHYSELSMCCALKHTDVTTTGQTGE